MSKLTILVCILVAGVVVGASLPIFDSLTTSSESIHNEGAGWLRFDLNRGADTTYNIGVSWDENGYYIANGSNVQTFDDNTTSDFETIIYADSNLSVWTTDGDNTRMLGKADGAPVFWEFTEPITIVRDSEGVVISDGSDSYAFGVPEWAYIPWSGGSYGFFAYNEERGVNTNNAPVAVVGGGNVGVYAYNDIYTYNGLGLAMSPLIGEDGLYYGAEWVKPVAPFDPDDITINPLDPSIINPGDNTEPVNPTDPDPGEIIDPFDPALEPMAVPTPTYTDGVWGYDIIQVDGVDKAVIVSYSGTGGDVIVPATVGGYDVYRVGKSEPNNNTQNYVFTNSDLASNSTITISNGIVEIGAWAFANATNFKGSLVIPDSVTTIGKYAFYWNTGLNGTLTIPDSVTTIYDNAFATCYFNGSLVIPDSVTSIGSSAFNNCYYLNGTLTISKSITSISSGTFEKCRNLTGSLVIPDSVTSIGSSAFKDCSNLTGTLTIPDSVTSIGSSAFNGCTRFTGTLIIPDTVTSIGSSAFQDCRGVSYLIIVSDAVPGNNAFNFSTYGIITDALDLTDSVDYSVNRYGIPSTVTVYDTIGDCFGYVAVADLSGEGGGAVSDLIGILPVIMLAGIVLFSIIALVITRK